MLHHSTECITECYPPPANVYPEPPEMRDNKPGNETIDIRYSSYNLSQLLSVFLKEPCVNSYYLYILNVYNSPLCSKWSMI